MQSYAAELKRALNYLESQQRPNGCVVGEVVWSTMITAQYVMVSRATGCAITPTRHAAILKFFLHEQRADGGWGAHAASDSLVFNTTLAYVALRMLGVEREASACKRARAWLQANGGVEHIPTWGKLWLWLMNMYGRDGIPPLLPELWLLPTALPFHPSKMYCHTRLIYMAMSYLYAANAQCEADELILDLRDELFTKTPFERIDWPAQREALAPTDLHERPSPLLRVFYAFASKYEAVAPTLWRRLALTETLEQIIYHQRHSNQAAVSPVNGLLNVLALHHAGHADTQAAFEGMDYWIWEDENGMRFCGANSNTWDTSFTVQALIEGQVQGAEGFLKGATQYLVGEQVRVELPAFERFFRDPLRGGFCFSDSHHRWPVSDCTGEAVSALCLAQSVEGTTHLDDRSLTEAVRFILTRENPEGGWGSYERRRGPLWMDQLNPSEMFGDCMVEHSYVECTASCMHGLKLAIKTGRLPESLVEAATDSIGRGRAFLLAAQGKDGSWPGFWGVHYTYGTMFGLLGLRAAGESANDPAVERAVGWFLATQRPDGSWGDHWRGCVENKRIAAEQGDVIQTAWALMALIRVADGRGGKAGAGMGQNEALEGAIERGARWLVGQQEPNGNWPQQQVAGVFFATAMHHYCMYKTYFPIWALGLYEARRVALGA